MSAPRHVAVIDIGKTNAKVALVDLATRAEIAVRKRANRVFAGPPYPHYDTDILWDFVLDALRSLRAEHSMEALTVTTHGASAALLDGDGKLALPVLDYEFDGPDRLAAAYEAVRPTFEETGSPRLPMGLNLGAQLYWLFETFPEARAHTQTIVTYPQYWVWRLTGKAVNEVTSLGCHTDLWNPTEGLYSSLVDSEGWRPLMAPIARAVDVVGTLHHDVAETTGIPADTPVYCGIHDSNASLYAHLAARRAPFAVVSTGTWVISMAVGGAGVKLDPARDTLINVNALGEPVPSARFMGGREFELMMAGRSHEFDAKDVAAVIDRRAMLLPAVEINSGPFRGRKYGWTLPEETLSDGERFATVSFYLALMTAAGLQITGAQGEVIVEGPFAQNPLYLDMLASATGLPVSACQGTGTSIGAALLVKKDDFIEPVQAEKRQGRAEMAGYAREWFEALAAG